MYILSEPDAVNSSCGLGFGAIRLTSGSTPSENTIISSSFPDITQTSLLCGIVKFSMATKMYMHSMRSTVHHVQVDASYIQSKRTVLLLIA